MQEYERVRPSGSCGFLGLGTNMVFDAAAIYYYNVYFKYYEDYHDYDYYWTGQWHDVSDRRNQFSFSWTTQSEDVYGTVPTFAKARHTGVTSR